MNVINEGASPDGGRSRLASRRSAVSAIVTALALAAGACGSGGSSASGKDVAAYGNQKYTDNASSPLAKYMGFGDAKNQQAKFREQNKKQQEIIAACMTEQGFDYIPFTQGGEFFAGPDVFGDLTKKAFAEKWGFGISTTVSADGAPVEGSPVGREVKPPEDPNQKARQAMSEAEGAAYDKALYGNGLQARPADGGDGSGSDVAGDTANPSSAVTGVPDAESLGCQGKASASLSGLDKKDEETIGKAYEALSKRLDADKRVKAAKSAYRACMKTAGFPEISRPDDVYEKVSSKMNKLYESAARPTGGDSGDGSGDGSSGDGSSGGGSSSGGEPAPVPLVDGPRFDSKELKKVQQYELSLAKAEFPCRAAFDLATVKVREEYEKQFIEKNRELLDKSKASGGLG